MWLKQEWFISPIYGDLGDSLFLLYPHHIVYTSDNVNRYTIVDYYQY